MSNIIHVHIEGLDKVQKNMNKLADDLPVFLQGARIEITNAVLNERGLRKYPPAGSGNFPPVPYYIRGRGMQTSATRNDGRSQRLGTRWISVPYTRIGMKISNPVSYAPYLHGEKQVRWAKGVGWRKLVEVAKSKVSVIRNIYQKWVDRLIKKHGL